MLKLACVALLVSSGALESGVTVHEDVTFSAVNGRELQCDIAIPEGEGPFPAIVMLHGGAWISGYRSRFRNEIEEAARRGFVGVTIDYRLAKTGNGKPSVDGFPAPLHDLKSAIRFLRRNQATYQIDSKRIGVMGESAGGHLALLAGLTSPDDGLEGDVDGDEISSSVQSVVNIFGPTDLYALATENPISRPALVMFLGSTPEVDRVVYDRASPIRYVRDDGPPILSFHGVGDDLVPVSQALKLDKAIRTAGGEHRLIRVANGHRFNLHQGMATREAMYEFFGTTLATENAETE